MVLDEALPVNRSNKAIDAQVGIDHLGEGRNRDLTASLQFLEKGALRRNSNCRWQIIEEADSFFYFLISLSRLDSESSLANRWKRNFRWDDLRDP